LGEKVEIAAYEEGVKSCGDWIRRFPSSFFKLFAIFWHGVCWLVSAEGKWFGWIGKLGRVLVALVWFWGWQVFRTGQIVKIGWVDLTVETDTTERIFLVCPFFNGNILGAEIR